MEIGQPDVTAVISENHSRHCEQGEARRGNPSNNDCQLNLSMQYLEVIFQFLTEVRSCGMFVLSLLSGEVS